MPLDPKARRRATPRPGRVQATPTNCGHKRPLSGGPSRSIRASALVGRDASSPALAFFGILWRDAPARFAAGCLSQSKRTLASSTHKSGQVGQALTTESGGCEPDHRWPVAGGRPAFSLSFTMGRASRPSSLLFSSHKVLFNTSPLALTPPPLPTP